MNELEKRCLLKEIEKTENEAKEFGFYWENINQLIEQIQSECIEVRDAWDKKNLTHLQEEIGDLIQAAVSLAIFCKLDPNETLAKSIDKFQNRYAKVVELVRNDGYKNLQNQPFNILIKYWNMAKQKT